MSQLLAKAGGSNQPSQSAHAQEFNIRVPKHGRKKHHVMRFNATLNVDFAKWSNVKLERENNMKEYRGMDEDMPKFGAGSEYNRDLREEVRRKKFGIIAKRYKPEAQPWILKVGGKAGKKFKGIREGGVGENAAFYVFTHAPDGAIEAYPLTEWYNFQPIQRYKALSAEEAEHEFGRRKKVMNFFSLMLRKRMKGDEEQENDPEEKANGSKVGGGKKAKELQISEMDEWIESDDDSDTEEDEKEKKNENSDDEDKGAKKNKKKVAEKKKKRDVDDEAFEESDDGDEEGRELDYISDSSEDEPDPEAKANKELKSVGEEDALKSSESEEEEDKKSNDSDKEDDEKKKDGKDKEKESKDKKKKKIKKKGKEDKKDSSSDMSSDSSDSDVELKNKSNKKKESNSNNNNNSAASSSRSASPAVTNADTNKRKFNNMPSDLTGSENSNSPVSTPAKKPKMEAPSLPPTFAGVVNVNTMKDDYGITEEAVRRYLMRKPMTATELLTKFKNKKTGVSSERLVETMTQILKKINPVKQTIQGKMYLSIKVNK